MSDAILFSPFGPEGRFFALRRDWPLYDRLLADLRRTPRSQGDFADRFAALQQKIADAALAACCGPWRAPFGRQLFILDGARRSAGLAAASLRLGARDLAPRILVLDVVGREKPARLLAFSETPSEAMTAARRHAGRESQADFGSVQFSMGVGAMKPEPALDLAWKKLLDGVADLDGAGFERAALSRHLSYLAKEIDRADGEVRHARRGIDRLPNAIALDVGTLPNDKSGPGRIFELGMVELKDGRRDGGSADQIRFNVPVPDLKRLKKADRDLLAAEKTFARFAPALRRKIGATPILGWNVDGDLRSLNREFDAACVEPIPRTQAIDLLQIARRVVPNLPKGGYELGRFAQRLSIEPNFRLHLSLQDADLVAHLAEHAAFQPHVAGRIRAVSQAQFALVPETAVGPSLSEVIRREMQELERLQDLPSAQRAAQASRAATAAEATRATLREAHQDQPLSPVLESVAKHGLQRLVQDVHEIARRMNPTVSVEVAARLVGTDPKSLLASGAPLDQVLAMSGNASALKKKFGLSADEASAMIARYREGIPVAGLYRRLENLAQISLDLAEGRDPIDAVHHELWHSIEQLLSDRERRTLLRDTAPSKTLEAARRDALAAGDKRRIEAIENETLAYTFAQWAAGRFRAGPDANAIWERLREFLVSLGHYLRGEGFDSRDAIFRRAYDGTMGRRALKRVRAGHHPTAPDAEIGIGATGRAAARGEFRIRTIASANAAANSDDGDTQFGMAPDRPADQRNLRLDLPLRLKPDTEVARLRLDLLGLSHEEMRALHRVTVEGLARISRAAAKYPGQSAGSILRGEIGAGLDLIEHVAAARGVALESGIRTKSREVARD